MLRLASTSPRRRLLLPLLGLPVQLAPVSVDEVPFAGERAEELVARLADAKASAATPNPAVVVLGADSEVVLDGRPLGKPTNARSAREMLAALRGRSHQVITGVALHGDDRSYRGVVGTTVLMRRYSDLELWAYVRSGRPLDKAGAYAIQDDDFAPVERIDGCYLNVVGLPLCEISRGLRALGWPEFEEKLEPPCRLCQTGQSALSSTTPSGPGPASR